MLMKRLIDILFSFVGLLITFPVIVVFLLIVWKHDGESPFFVAKRVGKRGKLFKMIKIRTMVINAEASGVDSTSSNDPRITGIGKTIRKYKIDELPQLFNILIGDMSLVGPRPNVERDVKIYTDVEKVLLSVKPGLTDFSSIVFSDESEILKDKNDPDIAYNQLIRPWKSNLGLFYIENNNILIDFILISITILGIFSRKLSLKFIVKLLKFLKAPKNLIEISKRNNCLIPTPPPGSDAIVESRQ